MLHTQTDADINNGYIPLTQEMHPIPNAINRALYDTTIGHQGLFYYLDSKYRDISRYSNPNKYVYFMEDMLHNIHSITLAQHVIPRGRYNITSSYNLIHFQETDAQVIAGTLLVATIPVGIYSANTLASAMKTAMDTAGLATYTVAVDPLTDKFSIASALDGGATRFNLIFTDRTENFLYSTTRTVYIAGTLGQLIGFPPTNLLYDGVVTKTWIAPNCYDINPQKVCILKLKFSAKDCEPIRSSNPAFDRAFCVFDVGDTTYSDSDIMRTTVNPYFEFPTPVEKFNRINVEFYDKYNNLYDFQGQDHFLGFYLITNSNEIKVNKF